MPTWLNLDSLLGLAQASQLIDKIPALRQTGGMRRMLGLFALAFSLIEATGQLQGESEIAVSIRYLQAEDKSHAHLFLYREDDGKLLRQLTRSDAGQDLDPIFAPDGETVVFTREISENKVQFWSIKPKGDDLKQLETAPEWYSAAKSSPYFAWSFEGTDDDTNLPPFGERSPTYRAPDGSVELVLRKIKEDEEDSINGPGHGKHYLLRDLKSGNEFEFGSFPGFEGAVEQLQLKQHEDRFLMEPPLRLAFFGVHLNSTAGDTSYALDLTKRRFVRLSSHGAVPFPLPGQPAFLTVTGVRYLPIPGSKKTANCSYLERWDAALKPLRYARQGTAAVFYGASMYRPGKNPVIVTIRKSDD